MIFSQFVDDALGCASYLIGDEDSGDAVVVDPPFAIEPVLEEARRRGVRLVRVLETHTHADHLSGHGRLALEHGLPVSIHPLAAPEFPFDPLEDGTEVALGAVALRALHTPGHRPEHTCLAVLDRTRADEPWLILTGDSLFVGDVARPDLAVEARAGAEALFSSLRRLLALGDGVEVFPGHVAGSLCGKAMSSKASTTIGFERRFNPALAASDVAVFVADTAAVTTPRPPNMERIVELNRGPFVGAPADPAPLVAPPPGAQVLDVRGVEEFARGHLPGAINVPVAGSRFPTKAAFVLDAERPLVVAAASEAEIAEATRGLRAVGFLELAGTVSAEGPERLELIPPAALREHLSSGAQLVDVREPDEAALAPLPGSLVLPYRELAHGVLPLPRDRPLVTICESGPRAVVAASVLAARGYDARAVWPGGSDDLRDRAPGC
ncbi:MAG: Zn-dependent hydrolase [Gaiellaceae bacterium]|nr:MAG: Zn-dependent hydrolase [Gaiellaceae bacterium]